MLHLYSLFQSVQPVLIVSLPLAKLSRKIISRQFQLLLQKCHFFGKLHFLFNTTIICPLHLNAIIALKTLKMFFKLILHNFHFLLHLRDSCLIILFLIVHLMHQIFLQFFKLTSSLLCLFFKSFL